MMRSSPFRGQTVIIDTVGSSVGATDKLFDIKPPSAEQARHP